MAIPGFPDSPGPLPQQIAELRRRLDAIERKQLRGPGVSTSFGAAEVRAVQLGFPAELTSAWDAAAGYAWKRLSLDGVTVGAPDVQPTGSLAVTPDNDTSLLPGTHGWLETDPQARGYLFLRTGPNGGGSATSTEWVAALEADDCLRLTLTYDPTDAGSGSGGESGSIEVRLTSTDGATWTGPPVTIGGTAYTPTFARRGQEQGCDGPCLTLAAIGGPALAGVRGAAGCAFVNFGFGRRSFFTCEPKLAGGACANLVRARVEQVPCRTQSWVSACCDGSGSGGFNPLDGVPRYMCLEWVGEGSPPFLPRTFDLGWLEDIAATEQQWGRNLVHTIGGTSYFHSVLLTCNTGYWAMALPFSSFGAALSGRSHVTVAETCGLGNDFEVVIHQGDDGSGPAIWRIRTWTEAGCAQPAAVAGWEGEGWYCVEAECEPLDGWEGEGWYCVEDATGSGDGSGGPSDGDDEGEIGGDE